MQHVRYAFPNATKMGLIGVTFGLYLAFNEPLDDKRRFFLHSKDKTTLLHLQYPQPVIWNFNAPNAHPTKITVAC